MFVQTGRKNLQKIIIIHHTLCKIQTSLRIETKETQSGKEIKQGRPDPAARYVAKAFFHLIIIRTKLLDLIQMALLATLSGNDESHFFNKFMLLPVKRHWRDIEGVPVFRYMPSKSFSKPLCPCLVYIHGGGWVMPHIGMIVFKMANVLSFLSHYWTL